MQNSTTCFFFFKRSDSLPTYTCFSDTNEPWSDRLCLKQMQWTFLKWCCAVLVEGQVRVEPSHVGRLKGICEWEAFLCAVHGFTGIIAKPQVHMGPVRGSRWGGGWGGWVGKAWGQTAPPHSSSSGSDRKHAKTKSPKAVQAWWTLCLVCAKVWLSQVRHLHDLESTDALSVVQLISSVYTNNK